MSIKPPLFLCPLQAHIPVELDALYQRTRNGVTDADKMLGLELLTEAYCDLIDTCFVHLLDEMNHNHPSNELLEAKRMMEEIKDKARHYVRWTGGFIANKRLPPVIAHFHAMTYSKGGANGDQPYMAFNLSPALAAEIAKVVPALKDGSAPNFDAGIELTIRVIDETMIPLSIEPKNLMKFNVIVNKTLDGVIALVRSILKRMLRKLAPKLPHEMFPQVGAHLQTFLIIE